MPDLALASAYTLRPAMAGDFGFLHDLHIACLKPYVEATWGWAEAIQRAIFADGFAPERSRIVLVADAMVGVVAAERRAADWFIAPALQGRGLGGALLRDVLADAARERVPVRLQVLRVNPARHLYERLGFTVDGETPTHYRLIARAPEPGQGGAGR